MARLRYNNALGVLGAGLSSGDTTVTFSAPPGFATLVGPDYVPLVLEPAGAAPSENFEVVWLTAFTAGASTGTILRGQEGTTAVGHSGGVVWECGPLASDIPSAYVSQILAGSGVSVSPSGGEGVVTVSATGGWVEADVSALQADWTTDGAGTWTFSGGVISQTDPTADSIIQTVAKYVGLDYAIEAEVLIPSGQDSLTTALAIAAVIQPDEIAQPASGTTYLLGVGPGVVAAGPGDGSSIEVAAWVDGSAGSSFPSAIAQDEWHTLRCVCSGELSQIIYLDGIYQFRSDIRPNGNTAQPGPPPQVPELAGLGAVGLASFRNIKIWTGALPV